jgi:8-oxo-dGTP diphosphatase
METKIFGEIIEGQDYKERSAVYGMLINQRKEIGIIKMPRGCFLPGGGIEEDETHIECLEREFVEETGLRVTVKAYLGTSILYGYAPMSNRYLKMIGYFYEVELNGLVGQKVEDDHELIWVDLSKAHQSMLLEHQAWAIENMRIKYNL